MSGAEKMTGQGLGADEAKTWSCRDLELMRKRGGAVGTWSYWEKDVELLVEILLSG